MNLELGLNILLVLLLLPTVVYVALLQRRLASLRADREAVESVIERMNEATRRAEASLKGIRQAAEQAKVTLDEPVTRAQALRDELSFLVQRADAAGERLAGGLSSAGAGGATAAAPAAERPRRAKPANERRTAGGGTGNGSAEPAAAPETDEVRSQAERDLINALRNVR
ncbi:hypothetical protein GCM10017083_47710 [Thalassobaculum fulvum]|jgi:hypothetical protein|uniref:DUF6468 domain-containing protein n=1 Tax=Thalassobaculum fulvum TaxID=1633335 RepID=A0A919CRU3_9PROT|nr:DUF6468 domain-containing protein [Thalassobaculum fulvum]GHD60967.1 hypothetical protein GCM10017083_47710 [Thalassobaculum fulvum]